MVTMYYLFTVRSTCCDPNHLRDEVDQSHHRVEPPLEDFHRRLEVVEAVLLDRALEVSQVNNSRVSNKSARYNLVSMQVKWRS